MWDTSERVGPQTHVSVISWICNNLGIITLYSGATASMPSEVFRSRSSVAGKHPRITRTRALALGRRCPAALDRRCVVNHCRQHCDKSCAPTRSVFAIFRLLAKQRSSRRPSRDAVTRGVVKRGLFLTTPLLTVLLTSAFGG